MWWITCGCILILAFILQTNEIIFQFLAYAPPHPGPREEAPPVVNSLFFSFHFYRFEALATQRVALTKRLTATGCQDNYAPRLLRKLEPGERIDEGEWFSSI